MTARRYAPSVPNDRTSPCRICGQPLAGHIIDRSPLRVLPAMNSDCPPPPAETCPRCHNAGVIRGSIAALDRICECKRTPRGLLLTPPVIEEAREEGRLVGWRISVAGDCVLVFSDQDAMPGIRVGKTFVPAYGKRMEYQVKP